MPKTSVSTKTLRTITTTTWIVALMAMVALIIFFVTAKPTVHANPLTASTTPTLPTLPSTPSPTTITATANPTQTPSFTPTQTATATQTPDPKFSPTPTKKVKPTSTPYPTPVTGRTTIIGYSVEGRPLEMYRYGSGDVGRLIVAGIHGGNEYNTINLAYELITYVEENPEIVPDDVTLYILPNLNPDGLARGKNVDGRVNSNGVDLNRNWPYLWQADWHRGTCWNYTRVTAGEYPASEPETIALQEFIQNHSEINALISYHSAALGIFAGGVPDYTPSIELAKRLGKIGGYAYPPSDIGCLYTGNFTDWASNTQEIAAVDIELHNHKYTDFPENSKILKEFLKWKKYP